MVEVFRDIFLDGRAFVVSSYDFKKELLPDGGCNVQTLMNIEVMDAQRNCYKFRFPPAEVLYFFELTPTRSTSTYFYSAILPTLKHSLSRTLLHFLPLAGNVIWPSHFPKPIILYTPNDAVSLTMAESTADFERLSGNEIHEAVESHPYVPQLVVSDTLAPTISLQITLFPNQGFCIGIAIHHAMLDGQSTSVFFKAWTHMCKQCCKDEETCPLPDNLTPFFDRSVVKDPTGLESAYLEQWAVAGRLVLGSKPKSLKLLQNLVGVPPNLVRATFLLPRESIDAIRERVLLYHQAQANAGLKPIKQLHLSTFVITCAYISVCLVKARGGDRNREVYFVCSVDYRGRLDSIPSNYFGHCVAVHDMAAEAGAFMDENGVAITAEKMGDLIKGLHKGLFEGARDRLMRLRSLDPEIQKIGIAGSTQLRFYDLDFGWGKPEKVEIKSIDRTGRFSIMESKDGRGGVEIGVVLLRQEMKAFASLFVNGLQAMQSKL